MLVNFGNQVMLPGRSKIVVRVYLTLENCIFGGKAGNLFFVLISFFKPGKLKFPFGSPEKLLGTSMEP